MALIYLGLLFFFFYHLNKCVHNITSSMDRFLLVTYVNTSLLQFFLWERFKILGPKPAEYEAVEMVNVEDEKRMFEQYQIDLLDKRLEMVWSKAT